MFALSAVRRAAGVAIRTESGRRTAATYNDIVSTRPTIRVSFAEKVFHGILLTVGIMAYPIYATTQMAVIKREEYSALEIPDQWRAWQERQNN